MPRAQLIAGWALVLAGALGVRPGLAGAEPAGRSSLPGLSETITAAPLAGDLSVALATGYGYRGRALGDGHRQHRMATALGASYRRDGWLAIGLELDGRYDRHTGTLDGDDDNLAGAPRLLARARHGLTSELAVAGQLGVWFPSDAALSAAGASPEARLALDYGIGAWTTTANLGFRFDRSGGTVDDPDTLSAADRMSLGVSDAHAVLVGVGVAWRGERWQAGVDWSWERLVGDDAPPASQSPMQLAAVARLRVGSRLWLGTELEVGLSSLPSSAPGAPLVPVAPQVRGWMTLAVAFESARPAPVAPPPAVKDPEPQERIHETGTVRGRVLGPDGAPLAGALVRVGDRRAVTDSEGRFVLEGVPEGTGTVVVVADGFKMKRMPVEVGGGAAVELDAGLVPDLPAGQIRGLVRTFRGAAIEGARVRVDRLDREVFTGADGRFELDVPPGRYRVEVSAPGHATQRRSIRVDQNGVTVLNIDLR